MDYKTLRDLARTGRIAQNAEKEKGTVTFAGCAMEPKLDGWRIIAEVDNGHVNFYARSGNLHNGHLPLIERELVERFPGGTLLDGELVHTHWGKVQSILTTTGHQSANAQYRVFDLIAHREIDARPLPYERRRKLLEQIFDGWPEDSPIQLVESFPADPMKHVELVEQGYEGTVVKRLSAPYASGKRGHGWTKQKAKATEDVVVMDFEAGSDVGAVVFGQFMDGKLVRRGTAKRKTDLIPTPDLMAWKGRVIEVEHNGVMPSGALRHPRLLRVRDDKAASECKWA